VHLLRAQPFPEFEIDCTTQVFFLKHLYHARGIRSRVLECFERADMPGISQDERDRLLSFIVVGGGPTSCEFTAELHDFIVEDVAR
jgi:NADH dehydrogenase FAD-containing subunit